MAFTKISDVDLKSRGATTLPNQPTISAQELKEEFDAPAKEIVAPKFNNLIDELEASTGAASLGAVAPTGFTGANIQALLNALASAVKTIEAYQVGATPPPGTTGDNVQSIINEINTSITNIQADITDLNAKKHTHPNKAVIDKFSEVGGDPYYDGNPIGGGGSVTVDSELSPTSTNPVQNKVITNTLNSMGSPSDIATAVANTHNHSNKALLDTYTQTESDLADAVAKKHTHSNKSTLDKLSEDPNTGNPTFNGNTIPTSGQTGGLQKFIESDIAPHTGWSAGSVGELRYEEQSDGSRHKYRYENGAWTRVFDITVHAEGSPATNVPLTDIVITSVDIGEGVSLDPGTIVLVVE